MLKIYFISGSALERDNNVNGPVTFDTNCHNYRERAFDTPSKRWKRGNGDVKVCRKPFPRALNRRDRLFPTFSTRKTFST